MDSRDRCPDCGDGDHHGCNATWRWMKVEGRVVAVENGYLTVMLPKAATTQPKIGQAVEVLWEPEPAAALNEEGTTDGLH